MPRPRKPDDEKMLPVSTCLPPSALAAYERVAKERRIPLATVLRSVLVRPFRNLKTDESPNSLTL